MHQTSMSFFALWKISFCSLQFETNEVEQFLLTPATSSVSPWSDSGRSPMILKMETQAAKEAYELIANIMEINKHNCTLFLKECIHANCTVVGKCWWNYQNISLLFFFGGGGVAEIKWNLYVFLFLYRKHVRVINGDGPTKTSALSFLGRSGCWRAAHK